MSRFLRTMLLRLGVVLVVAVAALPEAVTAQQPAWRLETFEDKDVLSAYLFSSGDNGFSLSCATLKPGPRARLLIDHENTVFTQPDVLQFEFDANHFSAPTNRLTRNDVLFVTGSGSFRLPEIVWDEYTTVWGMRIQATGAMFDAIATGPTLNIRSDTSNVTLSTAGFAVAYSGLLNACRNRFAAVGKPWKTGGVAQAALSMRQAAETSVAQGCNGPSTYEPGAFLSGNIDGDGVEDVVLDWRKINCTEQRVNPFCGASMCSADVYLSASFPRTNVAEMLLALGVRLQPLDNGNNAVAVGGSLVDCQSIGTTACEFLFYWNGSDLVNLP